jgi:hypothetical protein
MPEEKRRDNVIFRKLVQRNLLYYVITNIIFNSCFPYFYFKDQNSVHLFQGEYCFARFLLPMSLFLPFIITFDILKKAIALSEAGKAGFILPDNFIKNKFMFKIAGINGCLTLFVVLIIMLAVHFNLPKNYGFNGTLLSVLLGSFAGVLSVVFTLWPVRKVTNLNASPANRIL